MSLIEHSDDDWTPPTGPWTEADHRRWTAEHHREFRVQAEKDRAELLQQLEGAVEALRVCADRLTHGPLPGNEDWYEKARPFLHDHRGQ